MFIIKGDTFHVTWGDKGSFDLTLKDYTFNVGDVIRINVYGEEAMDADPVLTKSLTVSTAADTVTMNLLGADTKLGSPTNDRETYWYEITLNGDQTPFCYDEKGPKLFYIYPGGVN